MTIVDARGLLCPLPLTMARRGNGVDVNLVLGSSTTLAEQAADGAPGQVLATADELFSVLMGEDVEARRSFIQRNAKDVRFLDI